MNECFRDCEPLDVGKPHGRLARVMAHGGYVYLVVAVLTVPEARALAKWLLEKALPDDPPLPLTHWSKDPLVPYLGCDCGTCRAVAARSTEMPGAQT